MIKGESVGVVEVKSKHDNLRRSHHQIRQILDYIDYAYVVTDAFPRSWYDEWAGLLYLSESGIRCMTKARRVEREVRFESIASLKKGCLLASVNHKKNGVSKYEVAESMALFGNEPGMKEWIKKAALCSGDCSSHSPFWKFLGPAVLEVG
jgi:hypothetical protein